MDQDGGDIGGQRVQPEPHRLLPGLAAGHHQEVGALGQGVLVEEVPHLRSAVRRRDDHDQGHMAGGRHGPHGVDEHRGPAQRAERFGGARAEPYAAAGRGNHGGGAVRTRLFRHRLHSEASACLSPRPTWVWPQASRALRPDPTGTLSVTPGETGTAPAARDRRRTSSSQDREQSTGGSSTRPTRRRFAKNIRVRRAAPPAGVPRACLPARIPRRERPPRGSPAS